ncbi:MAG: adenylate/guanylate cyclase domain-containing protein [Chloroflexi bacterium]|nr:adenylate/guanylate cyclase domain-containing protein [Chloroflexota bacterium]
MKPETKYAKSGDVHIAYQVVGDGPLDLVVVPQYVSHLECGWEEPSLARFYNRLASFARLFLFDKRGTGLSDRVSPSEIPPLEQRMDDVRAVLDAAESERAALFGICEGATMSALFAATYPERTSALAMYGTWRPSPAILPPRSDDQMEKAMEAIERTWGQGVDLPRFAPSLASDPHFKQWWTRLQRLSASPGSAGALLLMNYDIDISGILPTIRVPTLVLHRTGDQISRVEGGRYTASRIPGARYVEMAGDDHLPWVGDGDAILDEIEEFLTGVRPTPHPDRVLATVLFTDIVGSTQRAAEMGDRRWRDLLDSYNSLARKELARFRGREVKTTGDGFLATFDGPARGVRCACAIGQSARSLGLEVRAGLHTGECELMGEDVGGIAVHIGARVAAKAAPGEVLVSHTVKDLVAGSGIRFQDRGSHVLRGVPDEWRLFLVETTEG